MSYGGACWTIIHALSDMTLSDMTLSEGQGIFFLYVRIESMHINFI